MRIPPALRLAVAIGWLVFAAPGVAVAAAPQAQAVQDELQHAARPSADGPNAPAGLDTRTEIVQSLLRLSLAALLGAALALRPRRRGTPPRTPAVVQTQIILAIVGALVMMVVGTNLARAFGVVGAAGLVRYRAKIADPKDAGVMLSTLAIGLGAGVGLYAMTAVSAGFILIALWLVESFETGSRTPFVLKIKMGDDTDSRRGEFEAILRRHRVDFQLRTASDEEVCYDARVPLEFPRDRVTNAILKLDPDGHAAVEWSEQKPKAK